MGPVPIYEISDSGFNPRIDLSYAPNTDLTTYISASKGYRPGGPAGPNYPSFCGGGQTPPYEPDTVWDYEIGEKAKLFDNWLSVNSDLYYIKWDRVQETVTIPVCGYTYEANAGNGRSFGPVRMSTSSFLRFRLISAGRRLLRRGPGG